jgi:methylmalonyl-CoA mutase
MSVSMTMNGAVIPILAIFIVAAEEQGVAQAKLDGTLQNDILKEFMVRNTYIYPPEPSMRIISPTSSPTPRSMPKFNSVSISGYHMQEAGATAVQELGYTIADGIEYARRTGQRPESTSLRRACQLLLRHRHELLHGSGQAARRPPALGTGYMHQAVRTTRRPLADAAHPLPDFRRKLTSSDPYNNVIRTTVEALAAALGGTQSLHTNALRRSARVAHRFSAHIARNTQIVLQEETGITNVVDPLAAPTMSRA